MATLCERAAGRVLTYFVRHASLLRPLPPPAKLQLAKDLAELQAGVGQSLWPLEALGPAVRCLRGFRALLFVEDTALDAAAAPVRDLPAGIALHHMFSRLVGLLARRSELVRWRAASDPDRVWSLQTLLARCRRKHYEPLSPFQTQCASRSPGAGCLHRSSPRTSGLA